MNLKKVIEQMPTNVKSSEDLKRLKEWWKENQNDISAIDFLLSKEIESCVNSITLPASGFHERISATGITDKKLPPHVRKHKQAEELKKKQIEAIIGIKLLTVKNRMRELLNNSTK